MAQVILPVLFFHKVIVRNLPMVQQRLGGRVLWAPNLAAIAVVRDHGYIPKGRKGSGRYMQ